MYCIYCIFLQDRIDPKDKKIYWFCRREQRKIGLKKEVNKHPIWCRNPVFEFHR